MEKEVKEVKKSTANLKGNSFYLTILDYIKTGKNFNQLCMDFDITKQNLCYYTNQLKRIGAIEKRGYGIWQLSELCDIKVKKFIEESSEVGIGLDSFKELLKKKELSKCVICGNNRINIHHITPVSYGGKNELFNLLPLCKKHHEEIHAWGTCEKYKKQIESFYSELKKDYKEINGRVRGHGFTWKIKLNKEINWPELLEYGHLDHIRVGNNKTLRVIFHGRKIWLSKKSIVIYDINSFFGENAVESRKYAVISILEILRALESKLAVNLRIDDRFVFKICRQHYSLLKNCLAEQCNREGKKINVSNEKGLWFLIDNSYNLNEAETVHPESAMTDNLGIQRYFNEHKETHFQVTPKFILETMNQQQNMLGQFTKQIESHLALIQEYRKENISWRKETVKRIKREVNEQKRLNEF